MSPASTSTLPLKDIHLPPAIGAWPPAPGWWISVIVLLGATALIGFLVIRHRRRTAYRRAALQVAREYGERFRADQDKTRLAIDCSELLRRVAIAAYGPHAAGIAGTRWLQFLNETLDRRAAGKKSRHGKTAAFAFSELEPALLQAPYRPGIDYDAQALQQALRHWIRHHKTSHKVHR